MSERDLIRSARHPLLPRSDEQTQASADATTEVDLAVSGYHRRLETDDWPTFQAPVTRLEEAA